MRCPNCGKEIQANALVCPYCLKQFVDSSASVEAIPMAVKDDNNTDALKNDGKILIRRYIIRKDALVLRADNKDFDDITLTDNSEYNIIGKVLGTNTGLIF